MAEFTPSQPVGSQVEPVLAEVLCSLPLFKSLLRFMSSDMAHENVLFLKEAQLFSYMLRPPAEMHKQACRIFFTFVCEGAPIAVNVGSETKKTISNALFSRKPITSHLFDEACLEIRNLIMPKFCEWIALKEWTRIPFERMSPPTFQQVLHTPELIASLCEFVKKQNSDRLLFEQFKTTDGVAEEHPPATNVDELDLSLRSCDEICNLLQFSAAVSELVESVGKGTLEDDAARSLWNQYRKKVPIKHTKGIHYAAFIKQWLKWLISEFSDSTVFGDWTDQRIWVSVTAYDARPPQTLDEHGYQEFPTLATLIGNKAMVSNLVTIFGDCEITRSVKFLGDVYKFVEKYSKALISDTSSSSDTVLKQMTLEAKELYSLYISSEAGAGGSDASIIAQSRPSSTAPLCVTVEEPGGETSVVQGESPMRVSAAYRKHVVANSSVIMLDKKLKAELRSSLFSRFKSRITYDMFSRCGAYVYRNCESTWFRDLQHTYIWTCMEYDNNSLVSRAIESLFAPSLVRDFPAIYPPIMDEILGNNDLRDSYVRVAYKNESERCTLLAFLDDSEAACSAGLGDKMASETRRLVDMIAVLRLNSNAELPVRYVHDQIAITEDVSPLVLRYLRSLVFESALALEYVKWSRGGAFRHIDWNPCIASQMTETNCVTSMLESFLDSARPALECVTSYGRPMIPGRQILMQKTQSSFRLVEHATSPPTTPGMEPIGCEASSANSSSSGGSITTHNSVTSESGNYVISSGSGDGVPLVEVPPLPAVSTSKKVKNPLAANAEVVVTPHPRVSDIISYMPRVPTFDETMDSVLLRKLFEDYYLFPRFVDETERNLWRSLRDFAACFSRLTDEDFTTNQPQLRAKAQQILDTYPSYLTKQPFLKSRLASDSVVTIRFFREEENILYGRAHQSYESLLEKSGWLKVD